MPSQFLYITVHFSRLERKDELTTWEYQFLLDDDLTSEGNSEEDTKEGDSEAPRQELSSGENDRRRPIEFRRELGESGDDSYETGSEG